MGNIVEMFHVEHIVITGWPDNGVMTWARSRKQTAGFHPAGFGFKVRRPVAHNRVNFAGLLQRAVAVIVEVFNGYGDGLLPILLLPTAC
jgi:hypothetical protein